MPYVKEYVATFQQNAVAPKVIEICEFNEFHADEIGSVLEPEGLPLKAAQALCEKWTKEGYSGGYPKYGYTLRIELCIQSEYDIKKE